jgi:cell wall-associated NlpC family hydrolase
VRRRIAFLFFSLIVLSATPVMARPVYHTIVSGDSLWTIAQRYNVSLNALEKSNNLSDASILQLGRALIVPGLAAPESTKTRAQHASAIPVWHKRLVRIVRAAAKSDDIAALQALWSATHTGVTPADIPGATPFRLADRALALDARITRTAMRYLGVPYSFGGTSFAGIDCSGFVQTVFERNGIALPRMADEQFGVGRRIASSLLMPGDLVFFETYTAGASHVGIYVGKGQFIHASTRGVRIDPLSMSYYASRYLGARRVSKL